MDKITDSLKERQNSTKIADKIFYIVMLVLFAILLTTFILNTYVFLVVEVSGRSMNDTLQDEDVLLVTRTTDVHKGDIVVIKNARDNISYWIIKRVIAVEGDRVDIRNNQVYINNELIDEPYAKGKTEPKNGISSWIVGEDEFFYLGDNREHSLDARENGVCKIENIVGVVRGWSVATRKYRKVIFSVINWLKGIDGNSVVD